MTNSMNGVRTTVIMVVVAVMAMTMLVLSVTPAMAENKTIIKPVFYVTTGMLMATTRPIVEQAFDALNNKDAYTLDALERQGVAGVTGYPLFLQIERTTDIYYVEVNVLNTGEYFWTTMSDLITYSVGFWTKDNLRP